MLMTGVVGDGVGLESDCRAAQAMKMMKEALGIGGGGRIGLGAGLGAAAAAGNRTVR